MLEIIIKKCVEVDEDVLKDDEEEEPKSTGFAALMGGGAGEGKNKSMKNILTHKIKFISKVSSLLKK